MNQKEVRHPKNRHQSMLAGDVCRRMTIETKYPEKPINNGRTRANKNIPANSFSLSRYFVFIEFSLRLFFYHLFRFVFGLVFGNDCDIQLYLYIYCTHLYCSFFLLALWFRVFFLLFFFAKVNGIKNWFSFWFAWHRKTGTFWKACNLHWIFGIANVVLHWFLSQKLNY